VPGDTEDKAARACRNSELAASRLSLDPAARRFSIKLV
jgi:hypothetical protein